MAAKTAEKADPKAARGTKRICQSCGAKFYDLTKDPIVCPMCEAVFKVEDKAAEAEADRLKKEAAADARKKADAAAKAAKAAEEAKDEEDDDDDVVDADDLLNIDEADDADDPADDTALLSDDEDDDMSDIVGGAVKGNDEDT